MLCSLGSTNVPARSHGNLNCIVFCTGWLNLLGQVALTASVDSCLANQIAAIWVIYNGHVFQQEELLLCYAGASRDSIDHDPNRSG